MGFTTFKLLGASVRGAQSIYALLEDYLKPPLILTLIGGGGKTSLLYLLAEQAMKHGVMTITATTTKMYYNGQMGRRIVLCPTFRDCCEAVMKARCSPDVFTLVHDIWEDDSQKVTGIEPEWVDKLSAKYRDTLFIVEGDGSAGKSLKGHLPHEPVIPASTKLVIPVLGLDVLGETLNEHNVHRMDKICELCDAVYDSIVTPELIIQLVFHPEGYLRTVPKGTKVILLLNKGESEKCQLAGQRLKDHILAVNSPQIDGVLVGSLRQNRFEFFRK